MDIPAPDSEQPTTYELAGIGRRFVASIIDTVVLIILLIIPVILSDGDRFTGFTVYFGYNWYYWTRKNGQTIGKKFMNIQVIKTDGGPLNSTDALLRTIGYIVSGAFLGIGYLYAIWDDNNQAWHDKIADTYVISSKSLKVKSTVTLTAR